MNVSLVVASVLVLGAGGCGGGDDASTVASALLAGFGRPAAAQELVGAETLSAFETDLESLHQQMKVAGMSAAVVQDGQVVWARGFGYADLEDDVPATPETPYHLASVTKPLAALVIMQLVQDGKLTLDDSVSRYGVSLPEGDKVTVRHLMSHTSAGTPGTRYQYDGNRYALLSQVIQSATGRSFQEWLFERILEPLGMNDTAPSPAGCAGLSFAPTCKRVSEALARPYQLDENLDFVPGYYQTHSSAAAGLISTVLDLAKLDAALDANTLVTAAAKEQMFAPTVSSSGQVLPYGLGWFTQQYRGDRLIWHYGSWPPSISSLFVKIPGQGLTLIVLANTDGLSRPFALGDGDVMASLVALTFYKDLVLAPRFGQPLPAIDWSNEDSTVLNAIGQVRDEAVRELLGRELSSRRMVASSLAQVQQHSLAEDRQSTRTTVGLALGSLLAASLVGLSLIWGFRHWPALATTTGAVREPSRRRKGFVLEIAVFAVLTVGFVALALHQIAFADLPTDEQRAPGYWAIAAYLVVAVAILLWSVHRWAYQKRAAWLIPLLLIADAVLAVRVIEAIF